MSIIREFTLYLHAGITTPKVIHANQYSQGETWIFKLLQDDGSVYVPSTGALIGVKADGHAIAGLTGTVLGDGRVSITTTQQLTAAAGDATCELTIDGGTNGSANFVIRVEKKPTDDAIMSDSDLSIIQQGIDQAERIAQYGSPLVATSSSQMTNHQSVYVYTGTTTTSLTNGHWYYWNGSAWADGGVYNSVAVTTDKTLTQANVAADAKATGDAVSDLKTNFTTVADSIKDEINSNDRITFPCSYADGLLSLSNGNEVTGDGIRTDFIHLENTRYIYFKVPSGCTVGAVFYDESKTYQGRKNWTSPDTDGYVAIDNSRYYLRVAIQSASIGEVKAEVPSPFKNTIEDELQNEAIRMIKSDAISLRSRDLPFISPSGGSVTATDISNIVYVSNNRSKLYIGDFEKTYGVEFIRIRGTLSSAVDHVYAFLEAGQVQTEWKELKKGDFEVVFNADIPKTYGFDLCFFGDGTEQITIQNIAVEFIATSPISNRIVIAASDSTEEAKATANYVCDGTNDVDLINHIIASNTEKTLSLFFRNGTYYIDKFTGETEYASIILDGHIVYDFEGESPAGFDYTQHPTPYISGIGGGVIFKLLASAYSNIDPSTEINLFWVNTLPSKPYALMNVKNISIVLPDNQRNVIAMNYKNCGAIKLEGIKIWLDQAEDEILEPYSGSIGIKCPEGGRNTPYMLTDCSVQGFERGFELGGEHVIGIGLNAINCVYSYYFGTVGAIHSNVLINCSEEHCINSIYFGSGVAFGAGFEIIGHDIEFENSGTFANVHGAMEENKGRAHGNVSYTSVLAHSGALSHRFWDSDAEGVQFNTRQMFSRIRGASSQRPTNPSVNTTFYDTTIHKMIIYTGSGWLDYMGNAV